MSKELEVLNNLRDNHIQLAKEKYAGLDAFKLEDLIGRKLAKWDILEKALNDLEDAKHNYKAIEEMHNNSVAYATKIQEELNELKKRNEPMKPIKDKENYRCARCHHMVDNHYCSDCGGAVDWSDENE